MLIESQIHRSGEEEHDVNMQYLWHHSAIEGVPQRFSILTDLPKTVTLSDALGTISETIRMRMQTYLVLEFGVLFFRHLFCHVEANL